MTDAAKVAALREAPKPWHVWTYRPSSGAQECGNCGMPFSELAYSDPDRFPCAALSASDSGEVAGLREVYVIVRRERDASLDGPVTVYATKEAAYEDIDVRTGRGTRPDLEGLYHVAKYRAVLTRPVSETPEAPAGTVALCGTAVAPHWHVFGPDCDSVATYDTEAEARAALAAQARLSFPTPADASGGREGLVSALAYALSRADPKMDYTETWLGYAERLAPLVIESGWLTTPPAPTPTVAAFLRKYDGYFDHRTVELGDLRKFAATAERPAEPTE